MTDEVLASAGLEDDVELLRHVVEAADFSDPKQVRGVFLAVLEALRVYGRRSTNEACACLDDDDGPEAEALPPARLNS